MAEGIEDHNVSLTKQNYIRLIELIQKYPKNEILDHVAEVKADKAQAVKMLAGDVATEVLPDAWDEIKKYPLQSQWSLFFLSIVFSHNELIKAFRESTNAEMRGTIKRSELGEKPYTNLANSLNEAGMVQNFQQGRSELRYDLTPVFRDMSIGPLAKQVIEGQLRRMGWAPPTSTDIWKRTFYEQCAHYGFPQALGVTNRQFSDWLEGDTVQLTELPDVTPVSGEIETSARLVSALATKKFAILAGSTGTGKTQTILRLVKSLNPLREEDPEFNLAFVPVGAGWTDARHLLGYRNPFGEAGASCAITPLIKLLLRANCPKYKGIPFFLILDEMNLSYVELYFSKFLSLMESNADGTAQPIVDAIDLELMAKTSGLTALELTLVDTALDKGGIFLSENVAIVGTVNVDETTHNFSPKVLDRAFVLECSPEKPSETADEFKIPDEDRLKADGIVITSILEHGHGSDLDTAKINSYLDELFLSLGRFKFGPRVTHEARRYWHIVHESIHGNVSDPPKSLSGDAAILDNIVFQKILPKLHGNKSQLTEILTQLVQYSEKHALPQSLAKLQAMQSDTSLLGFANFFSMQ